MNSPQLHLVAARILRRTLAGAAIVLLSGSCGPGYQAPPVSPQLVKTARKPASLLDRGYVIHQAKCAKCHPFENPANYDAEELISDIMPTMARKSKIDSADSAAVLEYLLAVRNLPPVPPATP